MLWALEAVTSTDSTLHIAHTPGGGLKYQHTCHSPSCPVDTSTFKWTSSSITYVHKQSHVTVCMRYTSCSQLSSLVVVPCAPCLPLRLLCLYFKHWQDTVGVDYHPAIVIIMQQLWIIMQQLWIIV